LLRAHRKDVATYHQHAVSAPAQKDYSQRGDGIARVRHLSGCERLHRAGQACRGSFEGFKLRIQTWNRLREHQRSGPMARPLFISEIRSAGQSRGPAAHQREHQTVCHPAAAGTRLSTIGAPTARPATVADPAPAQKHGLQLNAMDIYIAIVVCMGIGFWISIAIVALH
jgi:hypothetical protein